ncbi:unnamed protein product [Discosporangium mesarthrocarpum]
MGGVPGVLLCLWCRGGCSTATVAAALTFFPPTPPCYKLEENEGTGELELIIHDFVEVNLVIVSVSTPTGLDQGPLAASRRLMVHNMSVFLELYGRGWRDAGGSSTPSGVRVVMVKTKSGSTIPLALHASEGARFTLIYSHGNATDIGAMHDRCAAIAAALGVNVLVYDYTGYGAASGSPTESQTYQDIEAVYKWARENLCGGGSGGVGDGQGGCPHRIVLYGQSVGSGPTCYLAAKEQADLAGEGGQQV